MSRATAIFATILAVLALGAPAARANFGIFGFDTAFTEEGLGNEDGPMATQAGSHPFAFTVSLGLNFGEEEIGPGEKALFTEGRIKDLRLEQIPGLVADTTAYPRCSSLDFLQDASCPPASQVGVTASSTDLGGWRSSPVFNLTPPPGVLLRIGWSVGGEANIVIDAGLNPEPPYDGLVALHNTPQTLDVIGSKTQLWGDPADPAHDAFRGSCLKEKAPEDFPRQDIEGFHFESTGESESCHVSANPKPFLTLPTHCGEALASSFEATSWNREFIAGSKLTHDAAGNPQGFTGCGALPSFDPSIAAAPTSRAASSPTGMDFSLQINDEGLTSLGGRAKSHIRKAVVTLPEGMTANPSVAEGLEVCSESALKGETLDAAPGVGCPQASKIGTIEVESPLVSEPIKGALYQAEPYANLAENSLIAFYIVIKNPQLGIIVKQPVKVEADPATGQLKAITDNIPQVPFSSFHLHFREGGRSPLVTPPSCGSHQVTAVITPWSGQAPASPVSNFSLVSGPGEGPCPPPGAQPFDPGFTAGSDNNAAGAFSPFSMRLTRRDGDQDLVRFDTTLPPGVGGILAGLDKCPNAQIALAKTKTGKQELASPSCPLGSKIGSVLGGAGVGSQLTYARGSIYLAGPFGGAPLSVVGILPAVAGPFDVGTVVTRFALNVNPRTAQVSVDGAHSDPIPHILKGIPLVVRDIQVHADRPAFTYNPTSCDPFAVRASIWGGGTNPFSLADDSPVARQARYQAANCARLSFKPRLSLKLKGGTRRGAHPALHAVLRPRADDANIATTVARLPRSAFLDQAHIRTICTRVQYVAKACPPGSVYGHVRAFTPVLSEPLQGPIYLRSSNHNLPDLVFSLHGLVDFEAAARIDSKHGGIRVSFGEVPDAPISKVLIDMQGAKKGLIVNSTNLCTATHRAHIHFEAHNAKQLTIDPEMQASCPQGKRHAKRRR